MLHDAVAVTTDTLARYWLRVLVCLRRSVVIPSCSHHNVRCAQNDLSHKLYQCFQDCEDALRAQSTQVGPHNVYDIYDNCPRELHIWTHACTVSLFTPVPNPLFFFRACICSHSGCSRTPASAANYITGENIKFLCDPATGNRFSSECVCGRWRGRT
jgi:hypothetical protein